MSSRVQPTGVSCSGCEAACCRLQVLLIGDNGVPQEMSERSSWGGEVMRRGDDGWCAALDRDTMLCTLYAQRPQICRDYEMGGRECLDERVERK
jgi:Fe-S-cluster containining protein